MAQNYNRNQQNAVVPYNASDVMVPDGFNENVDLIIQTYAKDLTPMEMSLFAADAHQRGLSIVKRQIYATKFNGKMTIMVGIDGFRAQAESHPDYAGQDGPYWCGPDGQWHDVWLSDKNPSAAKIGVYRKGFVNAVYAVALWSEYGSTRDMWKKYPTVMLAKCAEAAAIRKAFPDKLGGAYVSEELDRSNSVEVSGAIVNQQTGEITPITEDAWERASKRLHAVAADQGVSHDVLHRWAVGIGKESIKDVDTQTLNNLADNFQKRPEYTLDRMAKYMAQPAPEPIEAEHRPINTAPPTPEEMDAALNNSTPGSLPLDIVDEADPDRFAR